MVSAVYLFRDICVYVRVIIYHFKTYNYLSGNFERNFSFLCFSFSLFDLTHLLFKAAAADNSCDLLMQLNHCDTTSCKPSTPPPWQFDIGNAATPPPSSYYHPHEECRAFGRSTHQRGGERGWGRPGLPLHSYHRPSQQTHTHGVCVSSFVERRIAHCDWQFILLSCFLLHMIFVYYILFRNLNSITRIKAKRRHMTPK